MHLKSVLCFQLVESFSLLANHITVLLAIGNQSCLCLSASILLPSEEDSLMVFLRPKFLNLEKAVISDIDLLSVEFIILDVWLEIPFDYDVEGWLWIEIGAFLLIGLTLLSNNLFISISSFIFKTWSSSMALLVVDSSFFKSRERNLLLDES